ncbi:hypothetical protein P153DRAFT_391360 [Dothidotthia symphoricarpi CBS 119687]|uniref:Uncharacterized protein n=1 Tax=Dothidotthia symphoricarpi CBS 119687 TaxID=1392245 RepID=A0A6A5ZXJ5_9PLEO|nr:uncharacterized protein P153DRAFT_391360 [Dothidotthia symphoricarpi CBS 119687]KAF2123634.1 hypothetical protein P153DRAFT_391360 [Dothidotthia symphoricarpi CBS 119687]
MAYSSTEFKNEMIDPNLDPVLNRKVDRACALIQKDPYADVPSEDDFMECDENTLFSPHKLQIDDLVTLREMHADNPRVVTPTTNRISVEMMGTPGYIRETSAGIATAKATDEDLTLILGVQTQLEPGSPFKTGTLLRPCYMCHFDSFARTASRKQHIAPFETTKEKNKPEQNGMGNLQALTSDTANALSHGVVTWIEVS